LARLDGFENFAKAELNALPQKERKDNKIFSKKSYSE